MGRPSLYSEELCRSICMRIEDGDNLDQLCKLDEYPAKDTVYRWLRENKDFSDEYERAREKRADARADRIDEWKRQCLEGKIPSDVARVAIDVEKWQAGKENGKRYGDKVQQEHTGNMTVNWPLPKTGLDE